MHPPRLTYCSPIEALQARLKHEGWAAFWLPHNDVHQNEYLPETAKWRDRLIGFTGSAGDALVLQDTVWLYADGRYHVQAEQEVPLTHVQVSKLGQDGHLTLMETLEKLPRGSVVAYDATTLTAKRVQDACARLKPLNITLAPVKQHPLTTILPPQQEASSAQSQWRTVEPSVHGRSTQKKLKWLRNELKKKGCTSTILSTLDDIAWLTNTRGQDIPYNPVFLSFMWVDETQVILFATPPQGEQTLEVLNELVAQGITLRPYDAIWKELSQLAQGNIVYWMPASNSAKIEQTLSTHPSIKLEAGSNIVQAEKAVKTPEEQAGMREANARSSVAVIRTLAWLDAQANAGHSVSEASLAQTIEQFYVKEGAVDLSFNTIAGIGTNTAIIHYGTPSKQQQARPGDWILLDSGAQYPFGTTDITRTTTFAQHCPSPEHRRAYTHVLKAHIAGAGAVFPKGSSGAQVDGIVRHPMWQVGYDFGHGTGHGVGCFLNVHEGPFGISKGYNAPLPEGVVVSIEPGYYVPGWGGIRLENLALVQPAHHVVLQAGTPQSQWYNFEILNLIPFARHLVDSTLLSPQEITWLKGYEDRIRQDILPRLAGKDETATKWLDSQWIV